MSFRNHRRRLHGGDRHTVKILCGRRPHRRLIADKCFCNTRMSKFLHLVAILYTQTVQKMCHHASDQKCIVLASKYTKNRLASGLRPNPLARFMGWEGRRDGRGKKNEGKGGRSTGGMEGRKRKGDGRKRERMEGKGRSPHRDFYKSAPTSRTHLIPR